MITEIALNVGKLIFHVSTKFTDKEVAGVKEEVLDVVGRAYDRAVEKARAAYKTRKRGRI